MKVKITDIHPNPKNPRKISDDKMKSLIKSIKEFPQMLKFRPIVVDEEMMILGGNMRYKALLALGAEDVEVTIAKGLTEEQKREFIIKDNNEWGEYDYEILTRDWKDCPLEDWGIELGEKYNICLGYGLRGSLREKFIIPPFTIIDKRQGYYQEREALWNSLGIKSLEGRKEGLTFKKSLNKYALTASKSSIFSPTLCEIMYNWFCPQNGDILDPFAGGSVRGIIANYLGFNYTGIDLNEEQIKANIKQ